MTNTRVLVQGASIAGPALAHWLRRYGAEVTVVEQAPGLQPGGQAVDARGVAKEVIRRMGLDAQVRAACTDTAGAVQVDADGGVLQTQRAPETPEETTANTLCGGAKFVWMLRASSSSLQPSPSPPSSLPLCLSFALFRESLPRILLYHQSLATCMSADLSSST